MARPPAPTPRPEPDLTAAERPRIFTFSSNSFTPMRPEDCGAGADAAAQSAPGRLTGYISRFLKLFLDPTESESDHARKVSAVLVQAAGIAFTGLWLGVFALLGLPHAMAINGVYNGLAVVNLALFAYHKKLSWNLNLALVLVTIYVVLVQTALGGMHRSGTVVIWAILAPLISSMLLGRRSAIAWLLIFIGAMALAAPFDHLPGVPVPELPTAFSVANTVMNIALLSVLIVGMNVYLVAQLNQARERADGLLMSMLPGPIAERLKRSPRTIAESHAEVSILFADLVGFTPLSACADPVDVVAMLNAVFTRFDNLAARHGLEKIKTIGDAYMVAGGLPMPRPDHARAILKMALEMLDSLANLRACDGTSIQLRIGVSTGPVVAGVIGKQKFSYDLWGDAVNLASRMESSGIAGRIQVSESTYQLTREHFEFSEREPIHVKGRGPMVTYLVERSRYADDRISLTTHADAPRRL